MRPAALVAVIVTSAFISFAQQPGSTSSPSGSTNIPPAAAAKRPEPSHDKPAEAVYQNIKSLKGVPSDELIPAMQYFTSALGVGCEFCHVMDANHRDFPSDQKDEKKFAREMIAMMKQINTANFKGEQEVTCATCHNGKSHPSRTAPLATPESLKARNNPLPPVDRASLPQPAQLFEAFTNAIGGTAAVGKLTTRHVTGQIELGFGPPAQFDAVQQAPNKVFTKIELGPDHTRVEGFDGTSGWTKDGPRLAESHGTELATSKLLADFYANLDPTRSGLNAQTRGKDRVGDKQAWVVRLGGKDRPQQTLYFDTDSKLLLRRVLLVPTPFGPLNTQLDYSDWREVNGVKVPFQVTQTRPSAILTQKFTKVEFNVPVNEKAFVKPEAK